jgi:hypothetical protein
VSSSASTTADAIRRLEQKSAPTSAALAPYLEKVR